MFWLRVIAVTLFAFSETVTGRLLSVREQALGKWTLKLNNGDGICEHLFGSEANDRIIRESNIFGKKIIVCDLTVKTDGSFILKPRNVKGEQTHVSASRVESELKHKDIDRNDQIEDLPPSSLPTNFGTLLEMSGNETIFKPIQTNGRWKIQSNPYCITDRHYDEITFSTQDYRGTARLWGRFGSQELRSFFSAGRQCLKVGKLTHGKIYERQSKPNRSRRESYRRSGKQFRSNLLTTFYAISNGR
mmetsp:Transcript_17216/g.22365  ORF Transcript_17216/g.22365 Transcript_17216/m.22365 type:complete len:246 (-) Transcript_17216:260-997(-)